MTVFLRNTLRAAALVVKTPQMPRNSDVLAKSVNEELENAWIINAGK